MKHGTRVVVLSTKTPKIDRAGIFEDHILFFVDCAGIFEDDILFFVDPAGIFEDDILLFEYPATISFCNELLR